MTDSSRATASASSNDTPSQHVEETKDTTKADNGWETVEKPGYAEQTKPAEETWEDLGSSKPMENQEGGTASGDAGKKP